MSQMFSLISPDPGLLWHRCGEVVFVVTCCDTHVTSAEIASLHCHHFCFCLHTDACMSCCSLNFFNFSVVELLLCFKLTRNNRDAISFFNYITNGARYCFALLWKKILLILAMKRTHSDRTHAVCDCLLVGNFVGFYLCCSKKIMNVCPICITWFF